MLSSLTDATAVLRALEEFDELGRSAFLAKYGFRPAQTYYLIHQGRRYDSKAIVGVAYGNQHPDEGTLKAESFSGGDASVGNKLRELGFEVERASADTLQLTSEDLRQIRTTRNRTRYAELTFEEKEAYRHVAQVLRGLGDLVVDSLGGKQDYENKSTSGFHIDSGVRGSMPKDLWFGVHRIENKDSFVGNPQLFMIVSTRGIEFGFAACTHTGDFSNQDLKSRLRDAAPQIYAMLPEPESLAATNLAQELSQNSWRFLKKSRLEPNQSDFESLQEWLRYFKSPHGSQAGGGSISRFILESEVDEVDLSAEMHTMCMVFRGLMNTIIPGDNPAQQTTNYNSETTLATLIPRALETFADVRKSSFKQDASLWREMNSIETRLKSFPALKARPNFKVQWSLGKGNWASIPWIAIINPQVAKSPTTGLFCVFLISTDLSRIYLALSQGTSDILSQSGQSEGNTILQERSDKYRNHASLLKDVGFTLASDMDLGIDKSRAKSYRSGTIAFVELEVARFPTDEILDGQLNELFKVYDDLSSRFQTDFKTPPQSPGLKDAFGEIFEVEAPKQVWVWAPGERAVHWNDLYENSLVAIGWDELGDLTQYSNIRELNDAIVRTYSNGDNPSNSVKACEDFLHRMRPGDIVYAKKGIDTVVGRGVVVGEYIHEPARTVLKNIRRITWTHHGEWKLDGYSLPLKTLTNWTDNSNVSALDNLVTGGEPEVLRLPPVERQPFSIDDALEGLLIDRDKFERILKLWSQKRNLILQGAPGVGKSFTAKRLAHALIGFKDPNLVKTVQFHQSYTYEDFVQGYRPNTNGGFSLHDGVFVDFCRRAIEDPDERYVFIIDEINRGNLSKILGELMLLVESDKRGPEWAVKLAHADGADDRFYVPGNVYILGMMNTADRSLAVVDYALRRRFIFFTQEPAFHHANFANTLIGKGALPDLVERIRQRLLHLNGMIAADTANLGPGFCVGHSFFMGDDSGRILDENWFLEVIDTEIAPLLSEYWFDRPDTAKRMIDELRQ